jgi:hypothetical protein
MGLYGLLRGQLYIFYVDDVRTSQETKAFMACYGLLRPVTGTALYFFM